MPHEPLLLGLGAPIAPAMSPAAYVRLRRLAAGLTIEQAARPFWTRPEHKADCEANTRLLEQEGVKAKQYLVETISRAFPFDPEVYRQLCEDPADRHPSLCSGCGCSTWTPCIGIDGEECRHTEDGVCTVCQQKAERTALRRAA